MRFVDRYPMLDEQGAEPVRRQIYKLPVEGGTLIRYDGSGRGARTIGDRFNDDSLRRRRNIVEIFVPAHGHNHFNHQTCFTVPDIWVHVSTIVCQYVHLPMIDRHLTVEESGVVIVLADPHVDAAEVLKKDANRISDPHIFDPESPCMISRSTLLRLSKGDIQSLEEFRVHDRLLGDEGRSYIIALDDDYVGVTNGGFSDGERRGTLYDISR